MEIKNTGEKILARSRYVEIAELEIVRSDTQYDWLSSKIKRSNRLIGIPVSYLTWLPDPNCWMEIPDGVVVKGVRP